MTEDAKTEQIKINSLKSLLDLVVENTKKEFRGRAGNTEKEQRLLTNHMEILLGRKPKQEELKRFHY
jgi:hypothetical protein